MTAADLTPAGLLIGFGVVVALVAIVWAAMTWRERRSRPRAPRRARDEDVVIDLTYLERAIKADAEAADRRRAEHKPLFSQSSGQSADGSHRLPTERE